MVGMTDVVVAFITSVFGGGVEALVLVGGLEVGFQVNSHFVRTGFFMPALACRSETAGLVHKVVAYVDLIIICDGVPTGFVKRDAVLEFLECLFGEHRRCPQGGKLVFV